MEKPQITIKDVKEMRIIYIRFKGTYLEFRKNSRKLFEKLFDYAKKNNLIIPEVTKVLTIYNDNPFITDSRNLRTSVAMTITVGAVLEASDEITDTIISGKFGVGSFELKLNEYGDAWHHMYHEWLFKSKEKARDSVPFELYVTEPPKSLKGKSYTDIYIPIE
ncbi:AraC family transcriptional regulator [Haploplasma axanthum]|uniref:DNA gyrase inhibitor n=1 Tax=Haploplasma axanthum TaxID=29552 RepID=A0A449BDN7_HAPAX|nr:GyrI-like domain-containing protein [Haploplasma axanthum]VEU80573.1 DNA gyrase inhibitor [Haploplasma axanthum]